MNGTIQIGHPVDVSSGVVYDTLLDAHVPGKFALSWERNYNSARHTIQKGLGLGWAVGDYFSFLRKEPAGYLLSTGSDETFFEDAESLVDQGGFSRRLGTFQELTREGDRYVVTRWDTESGEVLRFVFQRGGSSTVSPLVAIELPNGQGLDIQLGLGGRVETIVQRRERLALILEYDGRGLVISVSLSAGASQELLVRYEYDARSLLVAAYNELGFADRYAYDDAGRLVHEFTKDGGAFAFSYDAKGRCVRTSGQDSFDEKSLRYFDANQWTEVTDSHGEVSLYQWLQSGQISTLITPGGGIWKTEYDDSGRIVAKVNPTGAAERYVYDESGNLASRTEESGATFQFQYNRRRQLTAEIDPAGQLWQRHYDERGYLVADEDPLGNRTLYRREPNGDLINVVNAHGEVKSLNYDERGRVAVESDYENNRRQFTYNLRGLITSHIDPIGRITRFNYDAAGQLRQIAYADGTRETFGYDAGGNATSEIDRAGRVLTRRFGTCGRLSEQLSPDGGRRRYIWDSEPGRLREIINEKGESYRYAYTPDGYISQEIGFDGKSIEFSHDAVGNPSSYVDGYGRRTVFVRDQAGRSTSIQYADGSEVHRTFDFEDDIVEAVDAGHQVTITRDLYGNVVNEEVDGYGVSSEYDALGNRTKRICAGEVLEFSHNRNGEMTEVRRNGLRLLSAMIDPCGREVSRELLGGARVEYQYDSIDQLSKRTLTYKSGADNTYSTICEFRYDLSCNLVSNRDSHKGETQYFYNAADRLVRVSYAAGDSEAFEYDATGNITTATRAIPGSTPHISSWNYTDGDRLRSDGLLVFDYGENGELIRKSGGGKGDWTFKWDCADQLQMARKEPDREICFAYDAFGRRLWERDGERERRYVWDGDALCAIIDEGKVSQHYFIDQSHTPHFTATQGGVVTFNSNHTDTPTEGFDVDGKIVWSSEFSSLGRPRNQVPERLRAAGQWEDTSTGLFYNRFRYYDPDLGRYISQDPVRVRLGLNLYSYCPNPITWTDPFGLGPSNDSGKSGEKKLATQYPGGDQQHTFTDVKPARRADGYYPAEGENGHAREAKSGRTSLSHRIKSEIRRDKALMTKKGITVSWHFYRSPVTGKAGPTPRLEAALKRAGIDVKKEEKGKKKKGCGK